MFGGYEPEIQTNISKAAFDKIDTGSADGLILLRHYWLYPLILRSIADRDASRRIEATAGPSWFETAHTRLLTMRI